MNKTESMKIIETYRIAAVIRLSDLSQAQALTEALLAGGIRILEFTLTNPDAIDVMARIRKTVSIFESGGALIGIGSIRNKEQAQQAVDAGAQLLVAPTLLYDMIEVGKKSNVLTAPAGFTPTEIEMAYQAGADIVKVFPANSLGPEYIKSILAPMPELPIMPTGGISISNISEYLDAGAVAIGIGGSLLNRSYIADGNWSAIEDTAREYMNTIKDRS